MDQHTLAQVLRRTHVYASPEALMARRRRKNPTPPDSRGSATPDASRDHMARVRVADDVWAEFRAAAGATPISAVLGDLVKREVGRDRARRAKAGSLDDRDLLVALDRAHELQENLASTVAALERRLSRR